MKKISIKNNLDVFFVFIIIISTAWATITQAAYVEKVKGKKALIFLDGMEVEKGDLVYSVDSTSGKKTAILRITTVKDQKAIGQLVKGRTKINQEITPRTVKSKHGNSVAVESSSRQRKNSQFALGGIVGVNFDTMDIVISGQSVKMTGNSFGFGGVLDYNINDWLGLRGIVAYDGFSASADSSACSGNCETKISYLTSMLWGKINFIQKETKAWVGAGGGIWFPSSKKSTAIDLASINTTGAYAIGGGVDMAFGDTTYIPIQLEYGFLPKSDSVKTSYYSLRAGFMFKY